MEDFFSWIICVHRISHWTLCHCQHWLCHYVMLFKTLLLMNWVMLWLAEMKMEEYWPLMNKEPWLDQSTVLRPVLFKCTQQCWNGSKKTSLVTNLAPLDINPINWWKANTKWGHSCASQGHQCHQRGCFLQLELHWTDCWQDSPLTM